MQIYAIKALVPGAMIKPELSYRNFVCCKAAKGYTHIRYGNSLMKLPGDAEFSIPFQDKYGRGVYYLNYYEWKPADNLWNAM